MRRVLGAPSLWLAVLAGLLVAGLALAGKLRLEEFNPRDDAGDYLRMSESGLLCFWREPHNRQYSWGYPVFLSAVRGFPSKAEAAGVPDEQLQARRYRQLATLRTDLPALQACLERRRRDSSPAAVRRLMHDLFAQRQAGRDGTIRRALHPSRESYAPLAAASPSLAPTASSTRAIPAGRAGRRS